MVHTALVASECDSSSTVTDWLRAGPVLCLPLLQPRLMCFCFSECVSRRALSLDYDLKMMKIEGLTTN